jgi:MSHA biogenesis protein MshO
MSAARNRGFTLVEMVVAIAVASIVVGFMALFLVTPVTAYLAQERRTDLADSGNSARRMLESDIRNALPDSVRVVSVSGSVALELLAVSDVARYRASPSSGNPLKDLSLGAPDGQFALLGQFVNRPLGTDCNSYLVIGYPSGGDAYALSNVITAPGTCITLSALDATGEQPVSLNPAATFPATGSPSERVFYVTGPVSYVCTPAAGTLTRFEGYAISSDQSTHATDAELLNAGASGALVAKDVTACTFAYTPSNAHGPLAQLQITLARDGETVQVFEQVQVENRP